VTASATSIVWWDGPGAGSNSMGVSFCVCVCRPLQLCNAASGSVTGVDPVTASATPLCGGMDRGRFEFYGSLFFYVGLAHRFNPGLRNSAQGKGPIGCATAECRRAECSGRPPSSGCDFLPLGAGRVNPCVWTWRACPCEGAGPPSGSG